MFKKLFGGIKWFWRQVSPAAEAAWSMYLRNVARDYVQQFLVRNPKTKWHAQEIAVIVDAVAKLTGIKQQTAVRIVESVIAEFLTLGGIENPVEHN